MNCQWCWLVIRSSWRPFVVETLLFSVVLPSYYNSVFILLKKEKRFSRKQSWIICVAVESYRSVQSLYLSFFLLVLPSTFCLPPVTAPLAADLYWHLGVKRCSCRTLSIEAEPKLDLNLHVLCRPHLFNRSWAFTYGPAMLFFPPASLWMFKCLWNSRT